MRIAVINQHPIDTLGGSEIQCDIIAKELAKRGHEVTYFAASAKKTSYPVSYPVEPFPRLETISLYRSFRRRRIEVVYWRHNKKGLFKAALAAKLAGAKFVYALSSINDSLLWSHSGSTAGRLSRLLKPLYSFANFSALPLFADGAVCLNSDLIGRIPVHNQTVIHNSMSLKAHPFSWKRPFVVWIANIKRNKNPEQYIKLADTLRDCEVDFLMVGAIQDSKYRYLTEADPTRKNLFFLGPKTPQEVNGILNQALFLVHTCNPEGFGNNFIQAWQQGKPTLSLYFDPEDLITSKQIGFYSKTFSRFTEDALTLIKNPMLRDEMGSRAQAFAVAHFNPEANVRKLELFMLDLMSK